MDPSCRLRQVGQAVLPAKRLRTLAGETAWRNRLPHLQLLARVSEAKRSAGSLGGWASVDVVFILTSGS